MKTVFELIEANGLTLHGDIEHFAELVRADERQRQLAGVEMPEPEINTASHGHFRVVGYTEDQIRETVAAAVARKDAEIEQLKDKLDSSVHGHNQIFELCQVLETERDALKAEIERLKTAVADEREACARIADSMDSLQDGAIAFVIRARGNT